MIQGLLLAAGAGQRYGGDKLLQARWCDRPIVEHALRNLLAAVAEVVVVVAAEDDALARLVRARGARTVCNDDPGRGMGSSIAVGVAASSAADGWLIALADMPWVRPETMRRVAGAVAAGAAIAAPYYQGRRGHPVGFGAGLGPRLHSLDGETGARGLLQGTDPVTRIEVDDPGVVLDVDRPADLDCAPTGLDPDQ